MQAQDPPTLCDGRYRLLEILGEGGMAVVYRAFDEHLRVERAIKLLAPAAVRIPEARGRLETEARAMASLAHPNLVAVFDIRRDDKYLFLVMEVLTGGTLWEWVRAYGPMPARLAAQVMLQVLDAVQVAHAAGIIHRDLKPHNILLDGDGTPKVADFGIAHVQAPLADGSFTRTGTVLGTWAFMAPEQRHSPRDVGERTDVYAMGATLYSLVTADPPFDLFAADQDSRLLECVPDPLASIIRDATRYNPAQRFPSARAMAEAIDSALPDLDPIPEGTPQLGIAPTIPAEASGKTAPLTSTDKGTSTGGPAADLLFGRRRLHSAPFDDDAYHTSPELTLRWKIMATLGPAIIAALAGGLVLLWRGIGPMPGAQARVALTGDAVEVDLLDAQGNAHAPGPIDPGRYQLRVRFDANSEALELDQLVVDQGAQLTLDCRSETQRCVASPES